jgi:hypothetical protein
MANDFSTSAYDPGDPFKLPVWVLTYDADKDGTYGDRDSDTPERISGAHHNYVFNIFDAVLGQEYGEAAKTISGGVVNITDARSGNITVDTEGAGASDDLDTITNSGGTYVHRRIRVRAANAARTVVLKDGTGNLTLGADISLTDVDNYVELFYDGSNWVYVGLNPYLLTSNVQLTGDLDLDGDLDASTQATTVSMKDNESEAFKFAEGANAYQTFDTTDDAERVVFGKDVYRIASGGLALHCLRSISSTAAHASIFCDAARGTLGSEAVLQQNDITGNYGARAWDGSAYQWCGQARVAMDGATIGSGDLPTRWEIRTTPDGSGTIGTVMVVSNAGNVGIGQESFDATSAGVLALSNGATPPGGGLADAVQIWAEDQGGGNAVLHILSESGDEIVLDQGAHVADVTDASNQLDDQTGGSASGTHQLVDVSGADTVDESDIEDNFATMAAEYNALETRVDAIEVALETIITQRESQGLAATV